MEQLCKRLRGEFDIAAITNDIYTKEDARILVEAGALGARAHHGRRDRRLPAYRDPRGRLDQSGGDRRDANSGFATLDLILIESGGDNLAATFSPELADLTIYVIDVSGGEKIPRKGGPGVTRSDLLVINKIDLAPYVGASLEVMASDAARMRKTRPFVFANMKTGRGRRRGDRVHSRQGRAGGVKGASRAANSIIFGHKVGGGRLTCARHPWDISTLHVCCRVVGGWRVLFSIHLR